MASTFVPTRDLAILPGDAVLHSSFDLGPSGFCTFCTSAIIHLCSPTDSEDPEAEETLQHQSRVTIGTIGEIASRSSCKICRLVTSALQDLCPFYAKTNVQNQDETVSLTVDAPEQSAQVHIGTSTFYVASIQFIDELDVAQSRPSHAIMPPRTVTHCECCSIPKRLCSASTGLNFELIKYWIHDDDKRPSENKQIGYVEDRREMSLAYLIDVVEKRLVSANETARYCALSYVYGTATVRKTTRKLVSRLQQMGSLDQSSLSLSTIIKDAMTLVERLGERYLWVDSLCIVHDDPRQLQDAIASMGHIYESSVLTIIPLSATSADDRIPGVESNSRVAIPQAELGGKRIMVCPVPLHLQLKGSRYSSRAWTFQEQLLPSRGLYITAHVAYYLTPDLKHSEFRTNEAAESKINPLHDLIFNGARVQSIGFEDLPGYGEQSEWINYYEIVRQYSERDLTVPLDIIPAFTGIASTLERIHKTRFLVGHPESELIRTMHWVSAWDDLNGISAAKRRQGCSSWSWSGLLGPIGWLDDVVYSWWDLEAFMSINIVDPGQRDVFESAVALKCASSIAHTTGLTLQLAEMRVHSARLLDPGDGPPQALIKVIDAQGRWCGRMCPDSLEIVENIGFANLALMHLSTSRILGIDMASDSEPFGRMLFFDTASFPSGAKEQDTARIVNLLVIECKGNNVVERRGICQLHSTVWSAQAKSAREVTLI